MRSRRLAIALYDAVATCLVAFVAAFAWTPPAWAYIDPSVMTYTIQAVAGVAVALSAVLGVALRRGRRLVFRLLDIDEDARREHEPDVHRIVAGKPVACVPASADAGKQARGKEGAAFKPSWKERFGYALVVTCFTVFTVLVFSPLEVVGGSAGSLVFSVADVWWVLLAPALGIVVAWSLVLSAFRGRWFALMAAVTFAVGFAAYIQSLVLNVGLPLANGDTIAWADHMAMHVVSSAVWLLVCVMAVAYSQMRRKRALGICTLAACCLFVVQFVGAASLFVTPVGSAEVMGGGMDALNTDLAHRTEAVMTEDQLYTVNPNSNVVVFVLDTFDNSYLNSAQRSKKKATEEVLGGFTGFTYYRNATSAMIPTRFAIPFMLTGQLPTPDEPFSVYKENRYARSTFLRQMHDLGYSIGLYSDSLTIGGLPEDQQRSVTDLTVNIHKLPGESLDVGGTLYALYQMGLYRDAPWPLKWAFWYYTDSINAMIVAYDPQAPPEDTVYVMDDIRYYNRLRDIGLSIEDPDSGYSGAFRFIHLLGSHYPFRYDEYVNDLGTDGSSVIPQSVGALRIVGEYIRQLKDLGVYDQATIIVTADHGYWTITLDPLDETSTPIMFVKPAQSAELDALPYVESSLPVSHLDLQATILEAMGADGDEWGAYGYSMLSPGEISDNRVRLYLTTDSEPDLTDVRLREYAIDGDAQDWGSWSETGRVWSTRE